MAAPSETSGLAATRILLVEDNPGDARLIREMLRDDAEFTVDPVGRLDSALQYLRTHATDAVLLDLGLPDSRGLDGLNRMVSEHSDMPVIVVTGGSDAYLGMKSVYSGAQDYLVKGEIDSRTLHRTIVHAIERKRSQVELATLARFPEENPNPVMRFGLDGHLRYANPASSALLRTWGCREGGLLPEEWRNRIASMGRGTGRVLLDIVAEDRTYSVLMALVEGTDYVNFYATDITERNRAEQALRQSEDKYRVMFERAQDAVVIADVETGTILDANRQAEVLLGRSREEIIGMERAEMHPADKRQYYLDLFAAHMSLGGVNDSEVEVVRKDGTVVPVRVSAGATELAGRQVIQGIFRDISERKMAEEEQRRLESNLRQAQKMEAIGLLAGGIAHDFNNLLQAIIGYSELTLPHVALDSQEHDSLRHILDAGHRAAALVRQILTFSRRGEVEMRPIDLAQVVREAAGLLRASIPSTIAIETAIDLPAAVVIADSTQMHQVVMNLCVNAAYAMREHGGKLSVVVRQVGVPEEDVRAAGCRPCGDYIRLSISDTGEGMGDDVKAHLFEPFFTTKPQGKGTGMGLPVVYGILRSCGGFVTVESAPGAGTTFHVHLPPAGALDADVAAVDIQEVKGGIERIMVIDDEESLAEILKLAFEDLGYRVTAFTDSTAALAAFQDDPSAVDMIVTDQTMPHLTGIALASAALACRPDLPVILCTGFSESLSTETFQVEGVREVVLKPYDLRLMAVLVRRLLDESAQACAGQTSST